MCKFFHTSFACTCAHSLNIIKPCGASHDRPNRAHCSVYQPGKEAIQLAALCEPCQTHLHQLAERIDQDLHTGRGINAFTLREDGTYTIHLLHADARAVQVDAEVVLRGGAAVEEAVRDAVVREAKPRSRRDGMVRWYQLRDLQGLETAVLNDRIAGREDAVVLREGVWERFLDLREALPALGEGEREVEGQGGRGLELVWRGRAENGL